MPRPDDVWGDINTLFEIGIEIYRLIQQNGGTKGESKDTTTEQIADGVLLISNDKEILIAVSKDAAGQGLSDAAVALGTEKDGYLCYNGAAAVIPLFELSKTNDSIKPLMSISDVAPSRTRGSFYTSALTTLRLFTSKSIYGITSASDFSIIGVGEKKQALFIILPDEKTTFYPIASLIISQQYELLANMADRRGRRLQQRVNFMLDEFGNFTTIADFTNKLTVGGGRGMRFNLFLQSFAQLKDKYDENTANTIKSNCQTWIYLQADDMETLKEMSEKLGAYTTSSYQLSASHQKFSAPSSSHSLSLTQRNLLNVDEVRRVARPYQIVTSRTHPAMMYGPDLFVWHFNKMLGLGDKEHNRKLREERENKRPVITDVSKPVILWNVWVYYQKDIMRKAENEKGGGNPAAKFMNSEDDD